MIILALLLGYIGAYLGFDWEYFLCIIGWFVWWLIVTK